MHVDSWLDEYLQRLRRHHLVQDSEIVGCTESEVSAIEEEFRMSLPGLYRGILLRFGRSAGRLVDVNEFDFYYPDVMALNRRVRAAKEPLPFLPGDPFFMVIGRYDEVFQYVLDSAGKEDAAVYQVEVGDDAPPKAVYPSLTEVLEALLQDHLPSGSPGRSA